MTLETEVDNLLFCNELFKDAFIEINRKVTMYIDFLDSKLSVYEGLKFNNEKIVQDYSSLSALRNSLRALAKDLHIIAQRKSDCSNAILAILKYHKNLTEDNIKRIEEKL